MEKTAVVSDSWDALSTPLSRILGKRTAPRFVALGIETVRDLLYHLPFRLAHRGELMPVAHALPGADVTVVGRVLSSTLRPMNARNGFILTITITDGTQDLDLTFFAKTRRPLTYHHNRLSNGTLALFSGTVSLYRGTLQLTHPDYELIDEAQGVDVEAVSRPIPIYHASAKLPSWKIAQTIETLLTTTKPEDFPDPLPQTYLTSNNLPPLYEAIQELHRPNSDATWYNAYLRMKHEEAFIFQTALAQSAAQTRQLHTQAYPKRNDALLEKFDSQLPYTLTEGQQRVGEEISQDLSRTYPMQRLLQGDVGSGKTIVALRAMLQVVDNGGQAVLLAPTEVLAFQHYHTIRKLLGNLLYDTSLPRVLPNGGSTGTGVDTYRNSGGGEDAMNHKVTAPNSDLGATNVGTNAHSTRITLLTGSLSATQRRATLAHIASGEVGIIVGTHALLSDTVSIPFLGLAVIDEQHRFGVEQRAGLGHGIHTLAMTATPIPRTIAMSVFGDLDISSLTQLPTGRQSISTTLVPENNSAWMARVWQRAREEIDKGGRVYVVVPRINAMYDDGSEQDTTGRNNINPTGTRSEHSNRAEGQIFNPHLLQEANPSINPHLPQQTQLNINTNSYTDTNDSTQPHITNVEEMYAILTRLPQLNGINIAMMHGRLSAEKKTQIMDNFESGHSPLLISTTVIEVGVDVKEATMMIIMNAERFGLAQLHQLRGRIGRGTKPGICLAVTQAEPGSTAYERVQTFTEISDGFKLAEADMELRREGDVLGAHQAGKQSSLRFLSVAKDATIIETARNAARKLIEQDPQLMVHTALRDALTTIETQTQHYMERA
ncbi:ATP-dependent DNA helicase RecG [Actinotignum urinale]|uniref:ATP-dependent DNA helicase RecG n=1 Tax=Actinotignum urinale TaxID=190146 RepID=UPI0003B682AB|nr:ATP-dependent DNA helicase RecG [Actinotignum urinale]MDY5160012.1 ATP-dependent DNA helicase RecG [Actinotignum urinale]